VPRPRRPLFRQRLGRTPPTPAGGRSESRATGRLHRRRCAGGHGTSESSCSSCREAGRPA
jgi:hypothetical protein